MVLGLNEGVLILLYVGRVTIVLTTGPNIETCITDGVFAAHLFGGWTCVAWRH